MTLFSQVLQLDIPELFPLAEFEQFWTSAREILPNPSETRKEFNGASNLIAWRFRGCVEYHQAHLESWLRVGVAASFEEQYARERSLFGMFVCGVSTVESVCYACYALASGVPTLMLPFDERSRRIATPKRLYEQLEEKSSGSSLTAALRTILGSDQWTLWNGYRNTMAHRSSVPRIIFGALGGTLPPAKLLEYAETWSTDALSGDEETFSNMITWLAEATKQLLNGGIALARGA